MSEDHDLTPSQRDRIYRHNFKFFLADFVLFAIGMNLIGPSTVIPDFVRRLTDSEILIGLSSQLFDIGWMLPQLVIARYLVRVAHKKWWFIGPNILVRFAILIFGGCIFLIGPAHPDLILIGFLIAYGMAAVGDGIVGVPWVDLVGSSLDNRRRARLFGFGVAIEGLLTLGIAQLVRWVLSDSGPDFPDNYALLFTAAGLMFVITIPAILFIRELPGGKPKETMPSLREYLPELGRVLRDDHSYRAVVGTRTLSSLFTMAAPFYIGFATVKLGVSSDVAVSNLIIMQTLGRLVGALTYSWMGDRHNLLFIRAALLIAAVQPLAGLVAGVVGPEPLYLGFFAWGLVGGNLVLSYLNWVIMYATHDERPVYIGLLNTVSAVALLAAPLIGGAIVELLGYEAVFLAALIMIGGAFFTSVRYIRDPQPAEP